MTDGQTLLLLWAGLCFGPPLVWMAAIELVRWRNRRNVVDLSERRALREAQRRHPSSRAQASHVRVHRAGGHR